jgi:RHS repeat-associated protein
VYYSYDNVDRLTAEVWRKKSDNAQIYAFTYDYDPAGNRTKMRRESTAGTETQSAYYVYDADNSLTKRQVTTPAPSNVTTYYYYDDNGALTKMWDSGATDATYFEYGPNQLVTKVTPPAAEGAAWEFDYDGINRGGTERNLLWDGLNCLEKRNVSDGSLHARYTYGYTQIYGIGSCVEIYQPGSADKWYTLVMDHRGTAYAILDENGTEIGRRQYDAFGVILSQTGTWPTDLSYQTNWQTLQIGNKWWGLSAARLYDFETGRFVSRDFLSKLNKYSYSRDNPVLYCDPYGLDDAVIDKKVAKSEEDVPLVENGQRPSASGFTKISGTVGVIILCIKDEKGEPKYWVVDAAFYIAKILEVVRNQQLLNAQGKETKFEDVEAYEDANAKALKAGWDERWKKSQESMLELSRDKEEQIRVAIKEVYNKFLDDYIEVYAQVVNKDLKNQNKPERPKEDLRKDLEKLVPLSIKVSDKKAP